LRLSVLVGHLGLAPEGLAEADFEIAAVKPLSEATSGDLSFLSNPKYRDQVRETEASAILVGELVPDCPAFQVVCDNPYLTLARALQHLYPEPHPPAGVHDRACVEEGAVVSEEATIGPFCTVSSGAVIGPGSVLVASVFVGENTVIGQDCKLFPGVVVYGGCRLGDRVRLQANTTIGGDGFGYAQDGGTHVKVPQIGGVRIEDDVEIGANSAVDRGALADTVIGAGTKIDNQCQIAHGVRIGKGAIIVSQTGLSGSASLGDHSVLAGKVGVVGHVQIGDQVLVMGDSVVTKSLEGPGRYAGNPAIPHIQYQRQLARIRALGSLEQRVKALEAHFD